MEMDFFFYMGSLLSLMLVYMGFSRYTCISTYTSLFIDDDQVTCYLVNKSLGVIESAFLKTKKLNIFHDFFIFEIISFNNASLKCWVSKDTSPQVLRGEMLQWVPSWYHILNLDILLLTSTYVELIHRPFKRCHASPLICQTTEICHIFEMSSKQFINICRFGFNFVKASTVFL